jgi:basic membrane protein A
MKLLTRRFLVVMLVVALCLAPIGCASDEEGGDSGEKTYKVAMIANASIADGGWNSACYEGMIGAAEMNGWETSYSENVKQTDYVATFTEYANLGYDLVFAPGNEFSDAVKEAAASYPDINFIVLNGEVVEENVESIMADNTMIGFLAGTLAGIKTQTNEVAMIAGMEITPAMQSIDGFKQGVAYVNPGANVSVAFTNSWSDAAKGKEAAQSLIDTKDCDVFFGISSAGDAGMREAISDYDNKWTIAQPSDLLDQFPDIILTSIMNDNAQLIGASMQSIVAGEFGGKVFQGGLNENVLALGSFGESANDVIDEYMEIVDGIKDGSITFDYNV